MKRLVAGPRAVQEALDAAPARIAVMYVDDEGGRMRDLLERAKRGDVRCEVTTTAELDALAKGLRHQGVLAITGDYPYAELAHVLEHAAERPLLLALDQITDPHNFGAIVRSAVAFGVDGIITLKDRAAPVTPVVVRASAGATERARIVRVTNLAQTLAVLKDRGYSVVGLAPEADVSLRSLSYEPAGRVLVIGSEGTGMRRLTREACDSLAKIEMPGAIGSLNASVAAAIALYESARARTF
jgi:23S rRNA (guanosine2251-2'-O)-methyltransferase